MKILFTGGSSFTGYVVHPRAGRRGPRGHGRLPPAGRRVRRRSPRGIAWPWPPRSAGRSTAARSATSAFLALIGEGGWDLLCHHAADVTNYKSPDFDAVAALGE